MIVRVFDLESTGFDATDEVVEIATVDVVVRDDEILFGNPQEALVRPSLPIPPTASAVHHITDAAVEDAGQWCDLAPHFFDAYSGEVEAFCAHYAKFDGQWATDEIRGGRPLICTMKAALRVWPEAPAYSNQTLRYWLRLDGPFDGVPHRALPDAMVTAYILRRLLSHATIEEMIKWSAEPAMFPRINFGKHDGTRWEEIPLDYLHWMLSPKAKDLDADALWLAKREVRRRIVERQDAYMAMVPEKVASLASIHDLEAWFRSEETIRYEIGISKSSNEYERIVAACAGRKAELIQTAGEAA